MLPSHPVVTLPLAIDLLEVSRPHGHQGHRGARPRRLAQKQPVDARPRLCVPGCVDVLAEQSGAPRAPIADRSHARSSSLLSGRGVGLAPRSASPCSV
jgi:hypothetical protein